MDILLVSIPQAMKMCALGRSALYQKLADGSIRAVKAGRKTLVDVASLRAYAAALPQAAFKPPTASRKEL